MGESKYKSVYNLFMRPTIKDVARLAGCSIKTVSRVVNHEPYVSVEIQKRVQAAIRALGYAPNIAARNLVQKKSYTICILMYPAAYLSSSTILSRVMDYKFETGYDFLLQNYYPTLPRSKNQLLELIQQNRIDGLITTPPCDADGFVPDLLRTYRVPFVAINPFIPSEDLYSVFGDDYRGGKQLTQHLIQQGHRRIAFLRGPRNIRCSDDRMGGYLDALEETRISARQEYIQDSEFTFDGGLTAAKLLLHMPDRPTAVYAGSDEAGLGVMYACQEMGLRIPDDVAVGGHDDIVAAKYTFPGLTTIHQPMEELIEGAAEMLVRVINHDDQVERVKRVESRLIIRGSTVKST